GRQWLEGRVLWDDKDDVRLQRMQFIRIYVNGFQQMPAELRPAAAGKRERTFRADLVLNQAGANQVAMALPDLEQDDCSCTQLSLKCRNPLRAQRLHLLAISVVEPDRARLNKELLQAIQCDLDPQGRPTAEAFEEVYAGPALTGAMVTGPRVYHQL